MTNTLLTPTAVTREALRVLHQKLNFIGSINRSYDDSFAKTGAKIGDSLKVRLPNQYTVTTGATMTAQDTAETSVTLQVATQKHVGMNFSSNELTLSLDDFSKRIIAPAMAVLAASMEADATSMYKDIYQQTNQGTLTAALSLATVLGGRQKLVEALAPAGDWVANLCPRNTVDLVSELKALFHDASAIKQQYREGSMGRTAGFDFMENTHWARHTSGSAGATDYDVNGAAESGATITVKTGSNTFTKGDIVTFAGCYDVHPETKVSRATLKQFVITTAYAGGAGTIAISPSIIISGATQNCSGYPTDSGDVTKVAAASKAYDLSMLYHPDAFTFVTADLTMPRDAHFAAREVYDGISMRIWQSGDIINDKFPCRVDVLYGYKTIRPQLACRIASNSDA